MSTPPRQSVGTVVGRQSLVVRDSLRTGEFAKRLTTSDQRQEFLFGRTRSIASCYLCFFSRWLFPWCSGNRAIELRRHGRKLGVGLRFGRGRRRIVVSRVDMLTLSGAAGELKLKEEHGAEVTMVDQDAPAGKAGCTSMT